MPRVETVPTTEREKREIAFWSDDPDEKPGVESVDSFTHKMGEMRVFLEKLTRYRAEFEAARMIVEIGGGQGWASCILKRELGADTKIICTDISPDAAAGTRWAERVFATKLDGALACRSHATPFRDASVDLVFVFAAAHHFGSHRRTFREIRRVLRPGGLALYLHEPGCRDWIYPAAFRRVNRKRATVPEDVLRYRHAAELAREAGFEVEVRLDPTTTYRRPKETMYYLALQKLPFLQDLVPCTVEMVLRAPPA